MENDLSNAFGIECRHHFGITTHDFRPDQTPAETVYWYIRNVWHRPTKDRVSVTDENHTWEVLDYDNGSHAEHIIKNELYHNHSH